MHRYNSKASTKMFIAMQSYVPYGKKDAITTVEEIGPVGLAKIPLSKKTHIASNGRLDLYW